MFALSVSPPVPYFFAFAVAILTPAWPNEITALCYAVALGYLTSLETPEAVERKCCTYKRWREFN